MRPQGDNEGHRRVLDCSPAGLKGKGKGQGPERSKAGGLSGFVQFGIPSERDELERNGPMQSGWRVPCSCPFDPFCPCARGPFPFSMLRSLSSCCRSAIPPPFAFGPLGVVREGVILCVSLLEFRNVCKGQQSLPDSEVRPGENEER